MSKRRHASAGSQLAPRRRRYEDSVKRESKAEEKEKLNHGRYDADRKRAGPEESPRGCRYSTSIVGGFIRFACSSVLKGGWVNGGMRVCVCV